MLNNLIIFNKITKVKQLKYIIIRDWFFIIHKLS